MKFLNLAAIGVILLAILALIVRFNVVKVPIGQIGVLTEEWGDGLVEKDYGPGFHMDLGPLHSWALFDTTVQSLSMIAAAPEGALQVKSADGATVTMDITIKFRIKPGKCWALRKELGVGDSYKIKVRNEAIDTLRDVFGSMETEEFYSPAKRVEKSAEATDALRARLDKLHVSLIEILVRDVSFEQTFEEQIKGKALARQDKEVQAAKTIATRRREETNKVVAETAAKVTIIQQNLEKTRRDLTSDNDVKIAQIKADAERYVKEVKADADLYAAEKLAGADLLIKNAEAESQRLRQTALQGSGARNLIALEAAQNLKLTKFVVSTLDNNVLDLEKLAEKLGSLGDKK